MLYTTQIQGPRLLPYVCEDGICRARDPFRKGVFASLQRAVNARYAQVRSPKRIAVDGIIGPETTAAVNEVYAAGQGYTAQDIAAESIELAHKIATLAGVEVDRSMPQPGEGRSDSTPAPPPAPLQPARGGVPSWLYWVGGGLVLAVAGWLIYYTTKEP